MKAITITLAAALVSLSSWAVAAEPGYTSSREQRMNEALDNYRDSRNASPGPAARAENSIKRGAHKTGHAIERGAKKVSHAVGTGVHKTGEAIHHTGEKVREKTSAK